MNWLIGKTRLHAVGVAAVAFIAILVAEAAPSAATSYTLNFTGTVTGTTNLFSVLSIAPGDGVSGSVTFDPFNASPTSSKGGLYEFDQSAASLTFHVEHPGSTVYTHTEAGAGQVKTLGLAGGPSYIKEAVSGSTSALLLAFEKATGGASSLTDLSTLGTDPSAIIAMLFGGTPTATGKYELFGFGEVDFDIAFAPAVATTPLPATFPLFAAALGGLGFAGWRRRRIA